MHWSYICVLLVFTQFNPSHCFGDDDDHNMGRIKCTNRFEYRHQISKLVGTCKDIIRSNPICGKNYTVAYSLHPPYVMLEDGKVSGILPTMIQYALESCCFGCNSVKYEGPYDHFDKFYQNTDLVIPVQTSISNTEFFGHYFIHMLEIQAVSFFGEPIKHDPDKMVRTISRSVLNTYPLFIIALVMALTAGVAIWLLDTKWNESEFPNTFPRGPFEGFWWAFVSMTTVGYGDKSPRSVVARVFAIVWIAIGITMFSMYTASLTSALTNAVMASHEVVLYQKKIAVLNTTTIGQIATIKTNGIPIQFDNVGQINKALAKNKVDAIALDENIANYYMEHLVEDAEEGQKFSLYKRMEMSGSSYGAMAYQSNVTEFLNSFFHSNDDQRDVMAMLAMEGHGHPVQLDASASDSTDYFNSTRMLVLTIISLVIITIVITLVGLAIKYFTRQCMKAAKHDNGDAMNSLMDSPITEKDLDDIVEQIHLRIKERVKQKEVNGNQYHDSATKL
eukprot:TCONS_00010636-protein